MANEYEAQAVVQAAKDAKFREEEEARLAEQRMEQHRLELKAQRAVEAQ